MSLLKESTYKRPDAEVLPLITPAAARAWDQVRRISHATLGTAPHGGEAIDGAGAGEGLQGEAAARPYDSAHSPSLARPPQAPCPSHPPHPRHRSSSHCCCVPRTVGADAPLQGEAAKATNDVRRPSPLAAWMRGPERSSEVIICNQGQSGVIIRNQRAISGTQKALRGLSAGPQRPSEGPQRPSEVNSKQSEVIRGQSEGSQR
jgi:hypothetical protein